MTDDIRHKGQVTDRLPNTETPVTDRLPVQGDSTTGQAPPNRIPVTDRLPDQSASVTDRLRDADSPGTCPAKNGRVTAVLPHEKSSDSHASGYFGIATGDLVADRYLVQKGPLGGVTGEAEVFQCLDQQTEMKVALKYYKPNISPKAVIPEQFLNLDHPHIVSLKAYGEWAGRFFEVMEFCEGGSLLEYAPYREDELKAYIKEIITGLKYCHDQGIIHRDIKPNNLFFRAANKSGVVIGDFGISSILTEEEIIRITDTFDFATIDYAPWELLVKHEVSVKTDFYGLGITVIHLLTGRSPFQGMDPGAVLEKHIYGKVPIPDGIPDELKQLLQGLLRLNSQKRWGYKQVMTWLQGQPIFNDEGEPDEDEIYEGKEHPYPDCRKAKNPRELAAHLEDFDAENALFRGRISDWVFLHFDDAELAKRVEEIEEDYTDKKKLGVFKLRYTLDSSLPLKIGSHGVHTIEDLVELLKTSNESLLSAVEDALWGEFIECWIDATIRDLRTKELVEKIKSIRTRLKNKNRRLAVFTLLYTLNPSVPFRLVQGIEISNPEQLEDLLEKRPDLMGVVKNYLYGGQFEEWLRLAFPDRNQDHTFVFHIKNTYQQDKDIGLYAFRWHFKPSLPFPFGNEKVTKPKELAALSDRSQKDCDLGIELLSKGWIRIWLTTTGQMKESGEFDKIVNDSNTSWRRKLEGVLHLLDPNLPWPKITADQDKIELGKLGTESSKTVRVQFRNSGRGFLSGAFSLSGSGQGFSMDQLTIEGEPVTVKVTVNPQGLTAGSRQKTTLVAETNGGRLEIPVSYRVAAPLWKMIGRSLWAGILCALVLGIYRGFLGLTMPSKWPPNVIFNWHTWKSLWENGADFWIMIIWMLLLVGIVGGGIYYLIRIGKI